MVVAFFLSENLCGATLSVCLSQSKGLMDKHMYGTSSCLSCITSSFGFESSRQTVTLLDSRHARVGLDCSGMQAGSGAALVSSLSDWDEQYCMQK